MDVTTEGVAQFLTSQTAANIPAGASGDSLSSLAQLLAYPDQLDKFGQILNSIKMPPEALPALAKITPDQLVNVVKSAMSKPDVVAAAQGLWAATDKGPTVAMDSIGDSVQKSVQDSYETAGIVFGALGLSFAVPGVAVAVVALVVAIVAFVTAPETAGVGFVVAAVAVVVALIAFLVAVPALVVGIGGLIYAILPAEYRKRKSRSSSYISIQSPKGPYVCAESGGGGQLYANRGSVGGWETFGVVDLGGGKIGLQVANLQVVSAYQGGGSVVNANVNPDGLGDWETFTPVRYGTSNTFALKTASGNYIRADGQGGLCVTAYPNYATPGKDDVFAGSVFTIAVLGGVPPAVLAPGVDDIRAPVTSAAVTSATVTSALWVLGTDNKLYQWGASGWQDPGNGGWGTRLAMNPLGQVFLLNATKGNSIWRNDGSTWTQLTGAALDIAFGSDGSLYILGTDTHIYRWNGSGWDAAGSNGYGTRLAVSPSGQLFLLNANAGNTIWRDDGGTWNQVAGSAFDIAFGRDGSMFVIGTDNHIYKWNGSGWDGLGGSGTRLVTSSSGQLFTLDAHAGNAIGCNEGGTWKQVTGNALDIVSA